MLISEVIREIFSKSSNHFLLRRVRKKKEQSKEDYNPKPKTTAILQFFNKYKNIERILPNITSIFDEVIVIDDGSIDGSLTKFSSHLCGDNHYLIRSNDLYEVVMYSKAINFASGEIICLLQDDDIPPDDDAWLQNALQLFEKYPDLQILGGKNGLDILPLDEPNAKNLLDPPEGVRRVRFTDVNHYYFYHKPIYFDEGLGIPFMFSAAINRAPMFILRDAFISSGGIDQSFRPFQCDDVDACLRAWESGWQVGLYDAPFNRNVGKGGMRLYNTKEIGVQAQRNWGLIYDRYKSSINDRNFSKQVDILNNGLISPKTL